VHKKNEQRDNNRSAHSFVQSLSLSPSRFRISFFLSFRLSFFLPSFLLFFLSFCFCQVGGIICIPSFDPSTHPSVHSLLHSFIGPSFVRIRLSPILRPFSRLFMSFLVSRRNRRKETSFPGKPRSISNSNSSRPCPLSSFSSLILE